MHGQEDESLIHIYINEHTWPEHRYAAVDIFTCGDAFDPSEAGRLIIERLEAADSSVTEVRRGLLAVPDPVTSA